MPCPNYSIFTAGTHRCRPSAKTHRRSAAGTQMAAALPAPKTPLRPTRPAPPTPQCPTSSASTRPPRPAHPAPLARPPIAFPTRPAPSLSASTVCSSHVLNRSGPLATNPPPPRRYRDSIGGCPVDAARWLRRRPRRAGRGPPGGLEFHIRRRGTLPRSALLRPPGPPQPNPPTQPAPPAPPGLADSGAYL